MKQDILRGIDLIAIGEESSREATKHVMGCAACLVSASQSFLSVLDGVLGGTAEYLLCSPVECPRCGSPITETTLVSTDKQSADSDGRVALLPGKPEETNVVF